MSAKPYSAPLPLAAIYDTRLAGLDIRVLACIAFHDRMSLATDKGQGCWASHGTLAAEIGCNYINLGKSIKKLGDLGYLVRTKPTFGDRRGHVYRVPASLYAKAESESFGKRGKEVDPTASREIVGQEANPPGEVVCHDPPNSDANSNTSPEQYISLSDVRYSAEAEEGYSSEEAAFEGRVFRDGEPVTETLAKFERLLKSNPEAISNLGEWEAWLHEQSDVLIYEGDGSLGHWAQRLSELVNTRRWELGEIGAEQAL